MSINTWPASAIKVSTVRTQVNHLSLLKSFTPHLSIPSQYSPIIKTIKPPPLTLSQIHQTRPREYKSTQTYGMVFQWQLTEVEVHSQMKLYLGIVTLVATAAFIPVIAGLKCDSTCAVCFKDNDSSGSMIKFSCPSGNCGDACPKTYHGIQCTAKNGCE